MLANFTTSERPELRSDWSSPIFISKIWILQSLWSCRPSARVPTPPARWTGLLGKPGAEAGALGARLHLIASLQALSLTWLHWTDELKQWTRAHNWEKWILITAFSWGHQSWLEPCKAVFAGTQTERGKKKEKKKRIWDEASACIWFWIKGSRINVQFGLNLKAEAA